MYRFYCPTLPAAATPTAVLSDTTVQLDAEEAHHARRVLRLEPGQRVALLDGRGGVAEGVLEAWSGSSAVVRLVSLQRFDPPRPAIDLAVAMPKGPRADDMVNSLSQLGVARFIPLRTQRSVVDPRPNRLERYARAAIESAKQSARPWLMEIAPAADLAEVLAETPAGGADTVRLIADPVGTFEASLPAKMKAAARVLVLIGPEGGFTDDESAAARAAGCLPWRIGPHILRIETAAAAAAAIAGYLAHVE